MEIKFVVKRGFSIPAEHLPRIVDISTEIIPMVGDQIAVQTDGTLIALHEVVKREFVFNRLPQQRVTTTLHVLLRPMTLPDPL